MSNVALKNPETNLPRIPAADVFESDDAVRIVLDVPGVSADEVELTVEADELRLVTSGSRRYHRTFRLADTIDTDGIEATVANGLLTLDLPKAASARPRRLSVNAG